MTSPFSVYMIDYFDYSYTIGLLVQCTHA